MGHDLSLSRDFASVIFSLGPLSTFCEFYLSLKTQPSWQLRCDDICDSVMYNKKYLFGLPPDPVPGTKPLKPWNFLSDKRIQRSVFCIHQKPLSTTAAFMLMRSLLESPSG